MSVLHKKQAQTITDDQQDEEFRTFEIPGLKAKEERKKMRRRTKKVHPPRHLRMRTDQEWINVWPTASTFKWSAVPFPVRQGFVKTQTENEGVIPGKYANAELMKIPNFLHLTPGHIKKHCQAIKKFCTAWPRGLETDESCEKYFPLEVVESDYCVSGPSIRDPRARQVTVKVKLSKLDLDYHARDKMLRLVGNKYNHETDELTLTTDRCPLKKQNHDYAMYLLTALYHESWAREPWEAEKTEADMERYFWDQSKSKSGIISLLTRIKNIDKTSHSEPDARLIPYLPEDVTEETLLLLPELQTYKEAVEDLINEGENHTTVMNYKNSVKKLLNIKTPPS
ncbi:hypothetical protein ScPMuIL_012747 [Solemya velum]